MVCEATWERPMQSWVWRTGWATSHSAWSLTQARLPILFLFWKPRPMRIDIFVQLCSSSCKTLWSMTQGMPTVCTGWLLLPTCVGSMLWWTPLITFCQGRSSSLQLRLSMAFLNPTPGLTSGHCEVIEWDGLWPSNSITSSMWPASSDFWTQSMDQHTGVSILWAGLPKWGYHAPMASLPMPSPLSWFRSWGWLASWQPGEGSRDRSFVLHCVTSSEKNAYTYICLSRWKVTVVYIYI